MSLQGIDEGSWCEYLAFEPVGQVVGVGEPRETDKKKRGVCMPIVPGGSIVDNSPNQPVVVIVYVRM